MDDLEFVLIFHLYYSNNCPQANISQFSLTVANWNIYRIDLQNSNIIQMALLRKRLHIGEDLLDVLRRAVYADWIKDACQILHEASGYSVGAKTYANQARSEGLLYAYQGLMVNQLRKSLDRRLHQWFLENFETCQGALPHTDVIESFPRPTQTEYALMLNPFVLARLLRSWGKAQIEVGFFEDELWISGIFWKGNRLFTVSVQTDQPFREIAPENKPEEKKAEKKEERQPITKKLDPKMANVTANENCFGEDLLDYLGEDQAKQKDPPPPPSQPNVTARQMQLLKSLVATRMHSTLSRNVHVSTISNYVIRNFKEVKILGFEILDQLLESEMKRNGYEIIDGIVQNARFTK